MHLRNHGRNVVAYLPTGEQADHSENFRTQLRVFSSAGGRIVRDMEGEFILLFLPVIVFMVVCADGKARPRTSLRSHH